jgi:hypothetical protein
MTATLPPPRNLSNTNPAAPTGRQNVQFQVSAEYLLHLLVNGISEPFEIEDISGNIPDVGSGIVIGFVMNSGAAGSDVGPMLIAPHSGLVTKVKLVTKSSDGSTPLTFTIRQNGTAIFTAPLTVAAGTSSGTLTTFAGVLTSSPLTVAPDDIFTIDITSGSANWVFTVQIE